VKFYQTIAPMILCIMCTTPTFGSEKITLPFASEDTCNLVDEFRGEHDDWYKETGHVKPYSPSLDWMKRYSPAICATLALVSLQVACETLPDVLVGPLALSSTIIGSKARNIAIKQLDDSHLSIESPVNISIRNYLNEIYILGPISNEGCKIEIRSLSDIRFKNIMLSKIMHEHIPWTDQAKCNGLIYELKNKEVNIYLPSDYRSRNKLSSLPTPENVTAFDISEGGIIVTAGKDGIRKWKLQPRESLYTIIESYRSTLIQEEE